RKSSIGIRKRKHVLATIDCATLIVTAHSKEYREPERIVFDDINETPQVYSFQNIPIADLYIENGWLCATYDHITIKVKDIISNGVLLLTNPTVDFFPHHISLYSTIPI
ncbi:MAG: hypothetical protein M3380_13975, partial [Chloroflexota bacterium]|nr:hypothetical protein [Chloroflexota bacterium]